MNTGIIHIICVIGFILIIISLLIFIVYVLIRDVIKKENYTTSDKSNYIKKIREEFLTYLENLKPVEPLYWENDITICIKTFNRPSCLVRLIKSIRNLYMTVKIILIDDSQFPLLTDGFYKPNIEVIVLNNYIGVSGRNEGLKRTKTKYFMLMDDDMYLIPETNIWEMWNFLNTNSRFTLISGRLSDRGSFNGVYEIDNKQKIVNTNENKIISIIDNSKVEVNRAHNFFLSRTKELQAVPWDENLLTAEHEEHFYRMFLHGFVIADDSNIIIGHDKGIGCDDKIFSYSSYRESSKFQSYILHKHNLVKFEGLELSSRQYKYADIIRDINDKIGIEFHLFHGTALGVMKTRDIDLDDTAIDIAIFKKDFDKTNFQIISNNLHLTNVSVYNNMLLKGVKDNVNITITIIFNKPNFFWFITLFGNEQRIQKWKLPKYELQLIDAFGKSYYIFPIKYFSSLYGDNWQNTSIKHLPFLMFNNKIGFKWHDKKGDYDNDGPIPIITNNFVNDFFRDNIWIINMKNRPDKLAKSMYELSKINIKPKHFEGIDGKKDIRVQIELNKSSTIINSGEVGCALSHKLLWEDIVRNKIPWTLIFEDDIIVPQNITQATFGEVIVEATTGWRNPQVIYFGYQFEDYIIRHKDINRYNDVSVGSTQTCSTYAYAISWRGARDLLKTLDVWDKPIDLKMKFDFCGNDKCMAAIYKKEYNTYTPISGKGIIVHSENEYSDIGAHTWIKELHNK